METPIRILHLEDVAKDAELIQEILQDEGLAFQASTVKTRAEFEAALQQGEIDLILADYNLPGFDGLSALALAKASHPAVPFIFVSGSIGEELAIEISKNGATDYVLKDRLARLGTVVRRARREALEKTQRQKAEAALRASQEHAQILLLQSEQQFRGIFENSIQGMIIHQDSIVRIANLAAARIFGYTDPGQLVGVNIWETVSEEAQSALKASAATLLAGGTAPDHNEWQGIRQDGTRIWLKNSVSLTVWENKPAICGFYIDITQRQNMEAQLRQAQKMEAVGQLAGGVAHDFNNLLCVINGRAQMILNRLAADDPLRKNIDLIYKTGERAANLTRQLLAFSRRQVLELKVLDLNTVVNDLESMLRRLIREDIAFTTVLGPALGRIKADPGQMEQVLMNLVVNARDAMPTGGKLSVETANVELSDVYCRGYAGLKPGPYIMLAVSDTGCGMDDNVKAHLFEPFFTTKEQGKGTGLGLATVYGIVKQSLGNIFAESELGKGTTFKVYLPRTELKRAALSGHYPSIESHGTETILVVEDDESVRDLTCEILQSYGYSVLLARCGIEALSMYEKKIHTIHLVVSDVILPKMSGTDLIVRLRQTQPKVKVLFMSGYTDQMVDEKTFDLNMHFIQKPFTPKSMSLKVRAVLDDAQLGA